MKVKDLIKKLLDFNMESECKFLSWDDIPKNAYCKLSDVNQVDIHSSVDICIINEKR